MLESDFGMIDNRQLQTLAAYKKAWRIWEPPFVLFGTFLVFVLARYMQWGYRRDIFATIRFELLLGIFLIVGGIAVLKSHPIQVGYGSRLLVVLFVFAFVLGLQVPFAYDFENAKRGFTEGVLKNSFLTVSMLILIRRPRQYKWFTLTWLLACFYVYQESVHGLISGGLYWENQGILRLHGAVPIYHHPNSLGAFALDALPFTFYLLKPVKSKWLRIWFLAVMICGLVCLVFSGSRSAYLALVLFVGFMWLMGRKKLKLFLLGVAVLPILLLLVPEQYVGRFNSITGNQVEGHSREARIKLAKDAWTLFLENPAGIGLESFPKMRHDRLGRRAQYTHNLYLEILLHTGIQGMVVFILLIFQIVKTFQLARSRFEDQQRLLARAARRLGPRFRKAIVHHSNDLFMADAMILACYGFLFMHLVMGIFGHDLLYVYWWFLSGNALVLLRMSRILGDRTRAFVAIAEMQEDDHQQMPVRVEANHT